MKRRIYVSDVYHQKEIIQALTELLGDGGEVTDSLEGKFDFFFLYARDVLHHHHDVLNLKARFGNPGAQTIATSSLESFLTDVQEKPELGIDYVIDKTAIIENLILATSPRPGSDKKKLFEVLGLPTPS